MSDKIPAPEERTRSLRRLLRRSANRRDAPRFLYATPETEADVEAALAALEGKRPARWHDPEPLGWMFGVSNIPPEHTRRELAARSLADARLSPEQRKRFVRALLATLNREKRGVRFAYAANVGRSLVRSLLFFTGVFLPIVLFLVEEPGRWLEVLAFLAGVMGLLCSPVFLAASAVQSRRHEEGLHAACLEMLRRFGAVEGVAAAARAYAREPEPVKTAAKTALAGLLPLVREEHYGQLPGGTTAALCEVLDRLYYWPVTSTQVLEALVRAGDGTAVSAVRRLTRVQPPPGADIHQVEPLKARAAEVLPLLEERARREAESGMLLRASHAGAAPETLLRAASTVDVTPPEQMLRPSSGE